MHTIHAVIYTYKGSNLIECVNSIYDNASKDAVISVTVYDQHPLNRKAKLGDRDYLNYEHVFWDHQYTPINYKKKEIHLAKSEYVLSMSADITLAKDWDVSLIDFINGRNDLLISGQGMGDLRLEDKYFIKNYWGSSGSFGIFSLSNYIDRNFLFGFKQTLCRLEYPIEMKYYGEEEMLSLDAFRKDIKIYSMPTNSYIDNKERGLENLYAPFSIEHMYNNFIDYIHDPDEDDIINVRNFFKYHNVDYTKLKRIPYQVDDVLYDPNTMKIVDVGGERFIDSVKVIY